MENFREFLKSTKLIHFIFFMLLIMGFISLAYSFLLHQKDIKIPLSGTVNADIRINAEAKNFNAIKLFADEIELQAHSMKGKNTYVNYALDNTPIYSLSMKVTDDKALNDIDNIVLFVSDRMYYFNTSDIKNFEKKNGRYYFPNSIKYLKTSKFITDKGNLTRFSLGFLSLFYNMSFYIFPLICFILTTAVYLSNKDKINLGFNLFKNHSIWLILLLVLGLTVRVQGNCAPFWMDELYTSAIAANPKLPFNSIFLDPGNPPLFFIIAKLWQMITGQNEALLRLLPCMISVLSIYALFIFIKDNLSKNTALFISFLYTINVYSIYSAHEYRSYSLSMLLCILSGFLLFKIIKSSNENKPLKKYLILYAILSILMANTHYFQILILFSNFLYLMVQSVNRSIKLKFFIINIIAIAAFLPYFFITSLNSAVLDESFNIIAKPNFPDICMIFSQNYTNGFCASVIAVLGIILLFPFKKYIFDEKIKSTKFYKLFSYCLFTVFVVFISAFLISQIRPVIRTYYFTTILPYVVVTVGLMAVVPFKNKIFKTCFSIVFFIAFFMFSSNYERRDNAMRITVEPTFKYAYYDSAKYKNSKIAIFLYDYIEYGRYYEKYIKENMTLMKHAYASNGAAISKLIETAPCDIVYLRLELMTYADGIEEFEKFDNISLIRSYNDSLVARIIKKKP